MSLKSLTQLSHLITMMFGVALGISLCILYQYRIGIFIEDLTVLVILLVFSILFISDNYNKEDSLLIITFLLIFSRVLNPISALNSSIVSIKIILPNLQLDIF